MKIKHDSQGPRTVHECVDCKPQHTPTPWKVITDNACSGMFSEIIGSNRRFVIKEKEYEGLHWENKEDAAFIVRAVNSHEDLLSITQVMLDWLTNKQNLKPSELGRHLETLRTLTEKAIAKAEGKKQS